MDVPATLNDKQREESRSGIRNCMMPGVSEWVLWSPYSIDRQQPRVFMDGCHRIASILPAHSPFTSGKSPLFNNSLSCFPVSARTDLATEIRRNQAGTRSSTGWRRCNLTLTSTREPSRLMIVMSRSTVNRPRSALRMREKSAAAIPVHLWAARTLKPSRSSPRMISAAAAP